MSGPVAIERRLPELAEQIGQAVTMAERNWREAVAQAIRAGELLTEAKGLVSHGEWLPRIEANFVGSDRTARNYMRLYANRNRVADLPTVRDAVAMLTAPKPREPEPDRADGLDSDEVAGIKREAHRRVVERWGDAPHENPHIEKGRHAARRAGRTGASGKDWARSRSEAIAHGDARLAAAASRAAAASLVEPWEADAAEAWAEVGEILNERDRAASGGDR